MFLAAIIRFTRAYMKYRTTVAALGELDERSLRDIGLTRGQITGASWNAALR